MKAVVVGHAVAPVPIADRDRVAAQALPALAVGVYHAKSAGPAPATKSCHPRRAEPEAPVPLASVAGFTVPRGCTLRTDTLAADAKPALDIAKAQCSQGP